MELSFFAAMAWKSALIAAAALMLAHGLRSRSAADRALVLRLGVTTDGAPPNAGVLDPRPTRMRMAPVVPVEIGLTDTLESLLPGLSAAVTILTPER